MSKPSLSKTVCLVLLFCAAKAMVATAQTTFETLHSFDYTDGANPATGMVQGADGNFYGTTAGGGANGQGTVFKITPAGTVTTLHSFYYSTEGETPEAGLVQGTDWNFYGTTPYGGTYDYGHSSKSRQRAH